MPDHSLLNINTLSELAPSAQPELRQVFFFHDVRIVCRTNHPRILLLLEKMLEAFPEPEMLRGEACYSIYCYDDASQFPLQLPPRRTRTETLRLLTNTRLKCYKAQGATEYQSYEAQAEVNAPVLSIIYPEEHEAVTELEPLKRYQETFLQRYVFLIALGQLMRKFGFEPCHSAAITAPWDNSQGALILGHSGSGKTTLSLGCALSGCGLLGDDLIMLRADGQEQKICAYSIFQEVSVRAGSLDLWPALEFLRSYPVDARDKRYCLIEHLRPGIKRTRTPVDILIFPSLTDEASSALTPLSKARTLQMLIDLCTSKSNSRMSYPRAQERLFFLLSDLAQQASGYHLAVARGASDGPRLVRALFTGEPHE
ncbi:MAG TPA: hypothetical protein VKV40_11090 [Ktedonobacteraceae bacterium]|nr:hypothetical protein [Ktedonobacteraceae bacterium]